MSRHRTRSLRDTVIILGLLVVSWRPTSFSTPASPRELEHLQTGRAISDRTSGQHTRRLILGGSVSLAAAAGTEGSEVLAAGTEGSEVRGVRSPLRWVGSYPVLSLRFPKLSDTKGQAAEQGATLQFVVDTAASVNVIDGNLAIELKLEPIGDAPSGISTGGNISGGKNFMIGDCQLENSQGTFMTNLTASALPVAVPASGILGSSFLRSFPGGIEFFWGSPPGRSDASISFFADEPGLVKQQQGLRSVPVQLLPDTGLPSITLTINGVGIPALLDTGSPITVLNSAAARAAGVVTVDIDPKSISAASSASVNDGRGSSGFGNPFGNLYLRVQDAFQAVQEAAELAQRVANGDVVVLTAAEGIVQLVRSKTAVAFAIGAVEIGESKVLVGEIPGLALLEGLGASAGPAAILGVDVLRQRPRLVLKSDEILL